MDSNKSVRILSVDDETSFTELIREYFIPRGFEVLTASSGEEGLEILKHGDCDVALLDLKMTGLNGEEVMGEIKRSQRDIEIIFISAYNDNGKTKNSLLKGGAYAYVEKPVGSLKELESLIVKAAGSRRGKDEHA